MDKKKTVLITGASGLLGRSVFDEFSNRSDWDVVGLAFRRTKGNLMKVDLTNREQVHQLMTKVNPTVIIHSAAEKRPNVVETDPEGTKALNVTATRNICEEADNVSAWVLFISTDYVFDGTSAPYGVNAVPNPLNKYGVSKRDGELETLRVNKCNAVLRVPILYSDVEYLSESAVTVLFEKVKVTSKLCVMSAYERRYPTNCRDVAVVVRQMADMQTQNHIMDGYFHWGGDEMMTKYDMAVVMAEMFSLGTSHIKADYNPSGGAPRPYDSKLDYSRLVSLDIGQHTQFKEGMKSILSPWITG